MEQSQGESVGKTDSKIKSYFIRNKSQGQITFEIFKSRHTLKRYLREQKTMSDVELDEIRTIQIEDLRKLNMQAGVSYFTIILGNLSNLVQQFVEMSKEQVLCLITYKEIVLKFDKERSFFMNKIQTKETPLGISQQSVEALDLVFSQIRYVLTRFGRVINFFDALVQGHKRKTFTVTDFWRQTSAIKKIQQLENWMGSDSSDHNRRQSPSSSSSLNSAKNSLSQTTVETKGLKSNISQNIYHHKLSLQGFNKSPSIGPHTQFSDNISHSATSAMNQAEKVKEILEDLTDHDKMQVFERFMIEISQKWKDEYEDDRAARVPLIVCRICSQNFYADKEKQHSKYCMEKITKTKELTPINMKLLEISNDLTKCMLQVEKTNVMNTPRLMSSAKQSLLQTPTLSRRSPAIKMLLQQQESFSSDSSYVHNQDNSLKQSFNGSTPELNIVEREKQKSQFHHLVIEPIPTQLATETYDSSDSSMSEGALASSRSFKDFQNSNVNTQGSAVSKQPLEDSKGLDEGSNLNEKKRISVAVPLIPPLNFAKLTQPPQQTSQEAQSSARAQNSLLKLQMISGKQNQGLNQPLNTLTQPATLNSSRASVMNPLLQSLMPSASNTANPQNASKNVNMTKTNLRGLESARAVNTFKSFENVAILKTGHSSQSLKSEATQVLQGANLQINDTIKEEQQDNKDNVSKEAGSLRTVIQTTRTQNSMEQDIKDLNSSDDDNSSIDESISPNKNSETDPNFQLTEERKEEQQEPAKSEHNVLEKQTSNLGLPNMNAVKRTTLNIINFEKLAPHDQLQKQNSMVIKPVSQTTVQSAINNTSLQKTVGLPSLGQQKQPQQSAPTKKNYFAALTSIRKDLIKEEMPMSARPAQPGESFNFFKDKKLLLDEKKLTTRPFDLGEMASQVIAEELKKEEAKKPKPQEQISMDEPQEENKVGQKLQQSGVGLQQVPSSPYLYGVRKRFADLKQSSNQLSSMSISNLKDLKEQNQQDCLSPQIKIDQQKAQINSPYLNFSQKGLSQEQRKDQMKKLKDHVQSQIGRDLIKPNLKGDRRKVEPISNAFTLNIKNEREEVLRNIEILRRSIKLKKRSTPLEKIMSKILNNDKREESDKETPRFTQNDGSSNLMASPGPKPSKKNLTTVLNIPVSNQPISAKPSTQNLKLTKLIALQSIDEGNEEDVNAIPTPANKKSPIKIPTLDLSLKGASQSPSPTSSPPSQSAQKKVDDIGQTIRLKQLGMSPIISFRPLNKIASNGSSANTPQGTPFTSQRPLTQRDQLTQLGSSDKSLVHSEEDEQKLLQSYQMYLQTAKKELDILENMKTVAIEIFNLKIYVKSNKQRILVLKQYIQQLQEIKSMGMLKKQAMGILDNFLALIQEKLKVVEEIDFLEKGYFKTLPSKVKKQQLEEEKINSTMISRKINTSIQGRDMGSNKQASTQGIQAKRRGSNIVAVNFTPQLNGQQPEYLHQKYSGTNTSIQKSSSFKRRYQQNSNDVSPTPSDSPKTRNRPIEVLGNPSFQISATPLIQSRPLQSNILGVQPSINFLPTYNEQNNSNLHSIQEEQQASYLEQTQDIKQKMLHPQVHHPRKKSHFSNQKKVGLKPSKTSELDSQQSFHSKNSNTLDGLSKSEFNQSEFSVSDNEGDQLFYQYNTKNQEEKKLGDDSDFSDSSSSLSPNNHSKSGSQLNKESNRRLSHFYKHKKNQLSEIEDIDVSLPNTKTSKDLISLESFTDKDLGNKPQEIKLADVVSDQKKRAMHLRNFSCNENGSHEPKKRRGHEDSHSPHKRLVYFKQNKDKKKLEQNLDTDRLEKVCCQSDYVVGNNFDQELEEEEKVALSDNHEMFFVDELFKDQEKFNDMLDNLIMKESNTTVDESKLNTESLNQQELRGLKGLRMDQLYKGDLDEEDEVDDEFDEETESEEEDSSEDGGDDVLTMNRVRFNSLCVLPSQIDSCSIENYHRDNDQVSINDFILLKTISKGAYGKVILARKKNTSDLFAIKVLDKEKMVEKNVTQYVMNEREILNTVNNDYIVRGVYTFQSKKYLYMVMEFMKGGDFSSLLEGCGGAFDEETAKYYLAQIVLALEYLHSNGVIHRDLKPENILVDSEGHIKLTDFGLSETGLKHFKEQVQQQKDTLRQDKEEDMQKDIQNVLGLNADDLKQKVEEVKDTLQRRKSQLDNNQTITQKKSAQELQQPEPRISVKDLQVQKQEPRKRILGTADYMAPEVIQGQDHTPSLDFWSLGVVTFEFLTGALPFNDDTPEKVFKKILNREIKFPTIGREEDQMTPEAFDLINKLLTSDPQKRFGYKNINEIKKHPFFADIDWDNIMDEEAPFKPVGRDQDAIYFPNATDKDEDLKIIINDQKQQAEKQIAKEFNKFESVNLNVLSNYNQKEAKKAILRQERLQKTNKQNQPTPQTKKSMYNESILVEVKKGTAVKEFIEEGEEEGSLSHRSNTFQ